jgi:hypothetical protein
MPESEVAPSAEVAPPSEGHVEGQSSAEVPSEAKEGDAHGGGDDQDHGNSAKPGALTRVRGFFKDISASLFSSDGPTRRTALLFFIGILGIGVVTVAAVKRIRHVRARQALELKAREIEEKKRQEIENSRLSDLKSAENVLSLGRYVVALKPVGPGYSVSGAAPKADFELFVRCNEKEVREYIEVRTVQVRSELTSALVGMSREDFLAVDGKRRTHKKILLILNQWLAREYSGAHIDDAWFSDLVVE